MEAHQLRNNTMTPSLPMCIRTFSSFVAAFLLSACLLWGCGPSQVIREVNPEVGIDEAGPGDASTVDQAQPPTPAISFTDRERATIFRLSPLPETPKSPTNRFADDPKAAHLGRFLFFDPRLSSTGEVSCATCHNPQKGWGDGLGLSQGLKRLTRHVPTLWNIAYNRWYFWDGRADTVWSQALGPIENPKEMNFSRTELAWLVHNDAKLKSAYTAVFGSFPNLDKSKIPAKARPVPDDLDDPLHKAWDSMSSSDQDKINRIFANVGKSLEAYQRKIVSKDSAFDQFVEGWRNREPDKLKKLSVSAQRGLKLFIGRAGCLSCHNGPNFTDNEFHNIGLGVRDDLPVDSGRFSGIKPVKTGPFNGKSKYSDAPKDNINRKLEFVVQRPNNIGEFKTPTLRHIAETGPYMHDGRFKSLKEIVTFYSELKPEPALGHREESLVRLNLSAQEIDDLIAFLRSLTGKALPTSLLSPPSSPVP